jgi:hypothetical protein
MPRRKPTASASSHARRAIASAAARLMAEHGIADYGMAKRKAARSLGAGEGEALPTNEEIEDRVARLAVPVPGRRTARAGSRLAHTALEVMEALADFRPYLTGGALSGTAGRYSAIELELYADSSKDVEIALLIFTASPMKFFQIDARMWTPNCAWSGMKFRC